MTAWPPRDRPPQDLEKALLAFIEQHPVPDGIQLLFIRHYLARDPRDPSPDADPTRFGQPIELADHCRQVLIAYYQTGRTRKETADLVNMPVEYIEALERYLGLTLEG